MSDTLHVDADDGGSERIVPIPGKPNGDEDAQAGVGYKRPPVATRFKKGQSGNPSGRPRKSPSITALVERELDKTVPMQIDGKTVLVTKRELVAQRVVTKMVGGQLPIIMWFEAQATKHPERLELPEGLFAGLESAGPAEPS